jgi:pimeloyl-ACP methyl ester carboxylesterase
MATFVLVHGAWAGAHGFRRVRRPLWEAGHDVFTPSLTGIGERVHLTSPQVTLTTHVQDVVNQVLYEDLRDVVLLGFSYGGVVVAGALAHVADRVRHLVLLDTVIPRDGESAASMLGVEFESTVGIGAQWLAPPFPRTYDDPAEDAFMTPRRVPHPIASFAEPLRLELPLEQHALTRTYVRATGDAPGAPGSSAFDAAAAHARSSPAWRYREVASNHMVPSNAPGELVAILLECARYPNVNE